MQIDTMDFLSRLLDSGSNDRRFSRSSFPDEERYAFPGSDRVFQIAQCRVVESGVDQISRVRAQIERSRRETVKCFVHRLIRCSGGAGSEETLPHDHRVATLD